MAVTAHTLAVPTILRARSYSRLLTVLPLTSILIFQAAISLTLRNTAFQDEALYLYAGRQIFNQLLGGPVVTEPYSLYFSGTPYIYPVLAGGIDSVWGLEGARMLSLICMLCVTGCVYYVAKTLFNRASAICAAALFAVQGGVFFLGRLATYDAMCLALLALATVLALRAASARLPFFTLTIVPVLLLAVGTKYAGLLFVPSIIALLAWQTMTIHGWRQMLVRVSLLIAALGALTVAALLVLDKNVLIGLTSTTTNRTALMPTPPLELAQRALVQAGPVIVLAAAGLCWLGLKRLPLSLLLIGTAFLPPLYHIYKTEATSMPKHIVFGLFFAAPLAGYAIARLRGAGFVSTQTLRWVAGVAICLLLFGQGLTMAQSFYNEWANSDDMIRVLRSQVRPNSGRILAEESEVPRYYLQDVVSFWQWNHLYWFEYTDKTGQHLSGIPAYNAALAEGYFDLVMLRYGASAATAHQIDGILKDPKHYELIARLPYITTFGPGDFWVWRKVDP